MEPPISYVTVASPIPAKGKGKSDAEASSPESHASPPVDTQNLRGHAEDVSLSFLQNTAGLCGLGLPTVASGASSASTISRPSSASANNVTATGSDLDPLRWFKERPQSPTKHRHLEVTMGREELEDFTGGVKRELMKVFSMAKTTEERMKALEKFARANGVKVVESLHAVLKKQTEGNEKLESIKTQQNAMATQQTTMVEMLEQILQIMLAKEDADTAAATSVTGAAVTLLSNAEKTATADAETGLQKMRAEKNKLQKEIDRLRMAREKDKQRAEFLNNRKPAEQVLAEMKNAPPMPAQQKQSLAKHQHRMHPKTQEEAAKKRSGRMRFIY